eukprot:1363822-Alexandrium_andersonii.AAC.1
MCIRDSSCAAPEMISPAVTSVPIPEKHELVRMILLVSSASVCSSPNFAHARLMPHSAHLQASSNEDTTAPAPGKEPGEAALPAPPEPPDPELPAALAA